MLGLILSSLRELWHIRSGQKRSRKSQKRDFEISWLQRNALQMELAKCLRGPLTHRRYDGGITVISNVIKRQICGETICISYKNNNSTPLLMILSQHSARIMPLYPIILHPTALFSGKDSLLWRDFLFFACHEWIHVKVKDIPHLKQYCQYFPWTSWN